MRGRQRAHHVRPVSPSVICFANATSLVRGRLFLRAAESGGLGCLEAGVDFYARLNELTDKLAENIVDLNPELKRKLEG